MIIISLGLGVQSTAMYLMSSLGYIEKADYAIFADPGAEHPKTYKLLNDLKEWQACNNGIPLLVESKNLYKDLLKGTNSLGKKFVTIPAFSESKEMIMRQCTGEYKIWTVKDKIRELQGLKKRQRMKPCELWLGISIDEIQRMKESRMYNVKYIYPLIDKRITRTDCKKFLEEKDFQNVIKSACVFCPYQSDRQYKELKQNYPKEWKKVIKVDNAIRNNTKKGKEDKAYLHRTLKPINKVYLQEDQEELFMCEEGYCGI